MLSMIPGFTIGAPDLMMIFLLMSGLGMLIVILASSVYVLSVNAGGISCAVDTGIAVIAFVLNKVWMTSMLQMTALYNSIGGGAAGAFAAMELSDNRTAGTALLGVTLIGALIGVTSLSASLFAWAKLNGLIVGPLRVRGQQACIVAVVAMALAVGSYTVCTAPNDTDRLGGMPWSIYLLFGCGLICGALMTVRMCRTQLPVMISIFNAVTGLAVGLDGFVLRSPTLMIAGVAIGVARIVLTLQMKKC
jgi:H+-translocating NAD(P) transhydrogenase subunit beta